MSEEYREIAYWAVVQELEPAADIPLTRLRDALPEFLRNCGDPRKAGGVLFACLSEIPWQWPAWDSFAKKTGHESLSTINLAVSRMRPNEVLKAASLTQLRRLCGERNVIHLSRATKLALVDALLKDTSAEVAAAIVLPFRQLLQREKNDKCRQEMARHMAYRILSVAHARERFDQLSDRELLSVMRFWKFHWCGHTDIDAPKSCRRFDQRKLERQEASVVFPALPCSYLRCTCWISAERAGASR